MKILYVIDSHPENGGAPISTCFLAAEMSKIYSSVLLLLPSQTKNYSLNDEVKSIEIEGFEEVFPSLVFNPIKAIKLANLLRKKITEIKPNIIHVHMPKAAWVIGLLKALKLLPVELKYIYTDRDHLESYRWQFRMLSIILIKFMYNEVVCLTSISASYWLKQPGKAKVQVIPNFAGPDYEHYDRTMHNKVRENFNLDNNVFTVMFAGRMSVYKNWELAKKIVLNLKNDNIYFVFVILTMNHEQEIEFEKFCKDIKSSGVSHLILHNASQENMNKYYYMADVFVLTSDKESFGRTAIEAMSRKCVVIGRNTGGLPEVIGKKENILECDEMAFCKRIRYYKKNKDILCFDKEWFYERFNTKFTMKENIEKHKLMYEGIWRKK